MSSGKKDPDNTDSLSYEDNYSITSPEASELIRTAIAGLSNPANLVANTPTPTSKIVKTSENSFSYCPEPTSSSVTSKGATCPVAAKGTKCNKKHLYEEVFDSEEDDDVLRANRRKKQMRKKWISPNTTPVSSFSHSNKNLVYQNEGKKVIIKTEKVERKKAAVATDKKKQHSTPPIASISVRTSCKTFRFANEPPRPTQAVYEDVCIFCKNKMYLCHNNIYSEYCMQACHSYLHTNNKGWLDGFSPYRMEKVFGNAYSEIRRTHIFLKHGFYTHEKFLVPKCMEISSMLDAVDLGFKQDVDGALRERNEEGKQVYLQAKSEHKG